MTLIKFLKQIFEQAGRDKVGQLSAAFAYGTIFSLGPLLLVLISVIGLVYGQAAAEGQLYSQLEGVVGADTASMIQDMVANMHAAGNGILAIVIGAVGMLLGAAGITSQLQNSFNAILGVVPDPNGGIKRTIYVKVKNIFLVLSAGILLTVSILASAILTGVGETVQDNLGFPAFTLEILNNVLSLGMLTGSMYLIYRVLPDVVIPKKITFATAVMVAVLFVIGKIILTMIIGNNGTANAYGAAAALISLLLWVYYMGQIIFMGAEGMQVYGFNKSVDYKPKKFSYKRATFHLDGNTFHTRLAEAWLRGFRKRRS